MKLFYALFLAVFAFILTLPTYATCVPYLIKSGNDELKIGDQVELLIKGETVTDEGYIIGRNSTDIVIAEIAGNRVHMLPAEYVKLQSSEKNYDVFFVDPIIEIKKQRGPTCTGNAMYNCLKQISFDGDAVRELHELTEKDYPMFEALMMGGKEHVWRPAYPRVLNYFNLRQQQVLLNQSSRPGALKKIIRHLKTTGPVFITYATENKVETREAVTYSMPIIGRAVANSELKKMSFSIPAASRNNDPRHIVLAVGVIETKNQGRKIIVFDSGPGDFILWDEALLNYSSNIFLLVHRTSI